MKLNKTEQDLMKWIQGSSKDRPFKTRHVPGLHIQRWSKDRAVKHKGKRVERAIQSLFDKGLIGILKRGRGQHNHWTQGTGKGLCWSVETTYFTLYDRKVQDRIDERESKWASKWASKWGSK